VGSTREQFVGSVKLAKLLTMEPKTNRCWRKARIAARLLLKKERQPWSARDRALAAQFHHDPGVTNRLIDQAVKYIRAPLTP
jgi:hypothetical protein